MIHAYRINCADRSKINPESRGLHVLKFCRSVARFTKLTAIFLFGALGLALKRPATREQRAEWLHRFCARVIRTMNVAAHVQGTFPEHGVILSNHMGYLDIMAFAAQHRCVFVSKAELREVPLLGWMTMMAGTVFVERGRGGSAIRARSGLHAAADAGLPVVIFPEGTTSDGTSVLKFHSGALAQVMEAGRSVTAAFVSYRLTEDNGPDITIGNDVAFWGDEVRLFPHIFGLLGLRGIEVNLHIADRPIEFAANFHERKQAAIEARAAVMELGGVKDAVAAGDQFSTAEPVSPA
jgi:1-acyl-sn-glycerol-3-phosphate acyltransferase